MPRHVLKQDPAHLRRGAYAEITPEEQLGALTKAVDAIGKAMAGPGRANPIPADAQAIFDRVADVKARIPVTPKRGKT